MKMQGIKTNTYSIRFLSTIPQFNCQNTSNNRSIRPIPLYIRKAFTSRHVSMSAGLQKEAAIASKCKAMAEAT